MNVAKQKMGKLRAGASAFYSPSIVSSATGISSEHTDSDEDYNSSSINYTKLKWKSPKADSFSDLQFRVPEQRIPWKAIGLATSLFLLGSLLIIIGALLLGGVIDAQYSDRTWPLLILGTILFIPGAYHVRIAYYAYKGEQGYSFDDIPDFD